MSGFTSRLKPQEARSIWQAQDSGITLLKDSFKLRTLMLFGALGQAALCSFLPTKVAAIPATLLAVHSFVSSVVQYVKPRHDSPYMDNVVLGDTTAQLPNHETGLFASIPAADPVVVFHFGVRFNHPLGILCPGGREIGDHFYKSMELVQEKAEDYGLLGLTRWQSGDRDSQNTMMFVFYFRDAEGLRRFAASKIHRDAAEWAYRVGPKHIGTFHETFCVPRGAYESFYQNMPPTLLGQARVRCATNGGEKEETGDGGRGQHWVGTLVDAEKGFVKMQFDKMLKTSQGFNRVDKEGE
ncbi:hypothetical protein F4821DRAFT_249942 [Hypoxylon rubiginosum]|uniref:Uncharacterized protein n=1 Tax=Hypoxylon rubiginosum TaxID=110542 RepID=A0ACC0CLG7_9PEZI|nr:hypothetical protein F4821DRAFT_249942 [Hypoxylon rubiginosum]